MADVELVIRISEELYNRFGYEYREENSISKHTNDAILEAFCNGTVLPEGHGKLIDENDFEKRIAILTQSMDLGYGEIMDVIDEISPIIEADKDTKDNEQEQEEERE